MSGNLTDTLIGFCRPKWHPLWRRAVKGGPEGAVEVTLSPGGPPATRHGPCEPTAGVQVRGHFLVLYVVTAFKSLLPAPNPSPSDLWPMLVLGVPA